VFVEYFEAVAASDFVSVVSSDSVVEAADRFG
jgi:hypothetical protein